MRANATMANGATTRMASVGVVSTVVSTVVNIAASAVDVAVAATMSG